LKIFKLIHFNKFEKQNTKQKNKKQKPQSKSFSQKFKSKPIRNADHGFFRIGQRHNKYLNKGGPESWLTPHLDMDCIHIRLAGEIRLQIYVNLEHDTHGTGSNSDSDLD